MDQNDKYLSDSDSEDVTAIPSGQIKLQKLKGNLIQFLIELSEQLNQVPIMCSIQTKELINIECKPNWSSMISALQHINSFIQIRDEKVLNQVVEYEISVNKNSNAVKYLKIQFTETYHFDHKILHFQYIWIAPTNEQVNGFRKTVIEREYKEIQ